MPTKKRTAAAVKTQRRSDNLTKPSRIITRERKSESSPVQKPPAKKVVEIRRKWNVKLRIPDEIVAGAQVREVTNAEARNDYGLRAPRKADLSGTVFPYFGRESNEIEYARVRRNNFDEDAGEGKYHANSAADADRILYGYPGAWERLDDKRTKVVLVEAEKSVLACEAWAQRMKRTDLVFLGMGGCHGWEDKKRGILPDMATCRGHEVIALLDANVLDNKQVKAARIGLTAFLQSIACPVLHATLPKEDDVNGPDDYLAHHTDAEFAALLDAAVPAAVAPYSEHALAERLADENRDKLIHVAGLGWHVYDGKRWKSDDDGKAVLLAQQLCKDAAGERSKDSEQIKLRSRRTREAVLNEAQPHLAVSLDKLDFDFMLLNTPNGTVDLRTGKMREAERGDYITKLAGASPSASKPARWIKFLDEITDGDKELQSYLQRLAGYCLTGLATEQEVYFLYGSGANGKSVFVNALMEAMGEYAATAPSEVLMMTHNPQHSTSIAALRGARLVAVSEVEDGSRWAESKLKELSGGTFVKARFMRQDEFTFKPQLKLVISGNHKPRLRNVDESMTRRLRLLPFTKRIPENKRDTKLQQKLSAELDGILQWAIDGCLAWQRDGMQTPAVVRDASKEYFQMQDALGLWLEERTTAGKQYKEASSELYGNYKRWCEANGEYVLAQREFSQKLMARGFIAAKIGGSGIMHFRGLMLTVQQKF
jgi:P4 family phage/plasmid primase-like protien